MAGGSSRIGPFRLPPNQLVRFYRGGEALARFRGIEPTHERTPEDWVGSTTTTFGESDEGLSRLEDGRLVRDAIAADSEGFLGPGRSEPGLLVKLLDAGERLPVHIHPDDAFAAKHLGWAYGKTEAWAIVETADDHAVVGLGFREEVDPEQLHAWVDGQEIEAMRAALHELEVRPGDVVFVPAGLPHAIGEGILMVELQEPSDFSILLEWEGFAIDGPNDGHLGLGFDTALEAVDRLGWSSDAVAALVRSTPPLLPDEAAPFFRVQRPAPAELEPEFSILVVLEGEGAVDDVDVKRGDTILVPYAAGACTLTGGLDAIRCLPPRIDG
jgi:mannose-6-phosphate isomerase